MEAASFMMMGSLGLDRMGSSGSKGRHDLVWPAAAAGALLLASVALVWLNDHRAGKAARQQAVIAALAVGARDVTSFAVLAASGDAAALPQMRDRTARIDAIVAALTAGSKHEGKAVPAAAGELHTRLREFATRWEAFKRQSEASVLAAGAAQAQGAKDSKRRPSERAAPKPPALKPAANAGLALGTVAVSLVNDGHSLAAAADSMREGFLGAEPGEPWMLSVAAMCVIAALAVLALLIASGSRTRVALQHAAEQSNAATFDVLQPALRTLHIRADSSALADPAALGKRLSDEILVLIDGIKTLLNAVDKATAEADKFAVVGHLAAQALAAAEQKAGGAAESLQATARRVAAVYTALAASAAESQQQCAQLLQAVGAGLAAGNDAVRLGDQVRDGIAGIGKRHSAIAAASGDIAGSFSEMADQLVLADGLALRASDRFSGTEAAVQFAKDVRGHLGPSIARFKRAADVVRRIERECVDSLQELERVTQGATAQCRASASGSHALAQAEGATRELAAKISSTSRLASGPEASQLVAALDEIVRQVAQSSAAAREVLEATAHAASRIEELAKLLNTMKLG